MLQNQFLLDNELVDGNLLMVITVQTSSLPRVLIFHFRSRPLIPSSSDHSHHSNSTPKSVPDPPPSTAVNVWTYQCKMLHITNVICEKPVEIIVIMMMTSQNSLLTSWYNYLLPIVSDVRNKVFSQGLEKQIHLSNNQDFSCNQKYV